MSQKFWTKAGGVADSVKMFL